MDKDELTVAGETFIQNFQQSSNGVAVRIVLYQKWVDNYNIFGASIERSFQ